ncbi:MAG: hypothetical protein JNM52_03660 [Betaproteobacteria bacterium]|nr:hypothetical protein [Betaproteobacteria bacterium]
MAFFHVFLHGEHFLIEKEGKQSWMGFFKNVYVEAGSEDEACSIAISRTCADPAFRASVKNPPDQPPAMSVEEIALIEKDGAIADSDFVFIPEDA